MQNVVSQKQEPEFQSDCLYELKGKLENHRERLEEWKREHSQATKAKDMDKSLNNSIIIAAVIIAIAIVLAAFISRPSSGARYKSIGTDRIFDVQTGEVKWAEPGNQVSEKRK